MLIRSQPVFSLQGIAQQLTQTECNAHTKKEKHLIRSTNMHSVLFFHYNTIIISCIFPLQSVEIYVKLLNVSKRDIIGRVDRVAKELAWKASKV